jgi:hypothetical protein
MTDLFVMLIEIDEKKLPTIQPNRPRLVGMTVLIVGGAARTRDIGVLWTDRPETFSPTSLFNYQITAIIPRKITWRISVSPSNMEYVSLAKSY